ncbi:MAG: hypothetical protein KF893_13020 [Caldilineaceae bacterium]|nr:hypothetical protein [Caldilineaceae bacterium]
METNSSAGLSGRRFALIFLLILLGILLVFTLIVRWAVAILPQENEVITVVDAAGRIERGEIERILIQEDRDIFLYQPGQPRPLYTRLEPDATFTNTLESLGISPEQFPPLTVETD